MKKIIYITDYSANSISGLKYAVNLGNLLGDDVMALHVYASEEETALKKDKNQLRNLHQKKLRDFCKTNLGEKFSQADLSFAAVKGSDVPKTIIDFVRDLNVHMIVMGACGTSTIKEIFQGSTTREMIEISPFPVVAVPKEFTAEGVDKVVFASVLKDGDVDNILELVQMMGSLKPQIEVIHVTQKSAGPAQEALNDFQKKVLERTDYEKINFNSFFSEDVYSTLELAIEQNQPDLVIIPEQREKNQVGKIIIRDRIKKVQSHTKVPLLSFPMAG